MGMPVSASAYFLIELLREKYGFKGYVVSDSEAVEFVETKHHVAGDYKEAVRQVIEGGLNVRTNFDSPGKFILPLRELVKEGKVSMNTLDKRVSDVLRVKFELGLFDHPYVTDPKAADEIVGEAKNEKFVMDMAHQSLVLLKNKDNFLPLDAKRIKNIFVTGPLAAETKYVISRYGPARLTPTSILDGFKKYGSSKQLNISYEKGSEVIDAGWPQSTLIETPLTEQEQQMINQAVQKATQSDVVVAVVGQDETITGRKPFSNRLRIYQGRQLKLLQALKATGKPMLVVLVNGQPLTINWVQQNADGIIETWFSNTRAGEAVTDVVFGDYNPGGKLPITFPKTVGQIEFNFPFKPGSQAGQPGEGPNGSGNTLVNGALYPFGFGLSYTSFEYSNLKIQQPTKHSQSEIKISCEIKNVGARPGDEVVQLYVKDIVSSVTVYEYDLRGFERISLAPGETKTVEFTLKPGDLACWIKI
jgi:beta-glucosidase